MACAKGGDIMTRYGGVEGHMVCMETSVLFDGGLGTSPSGRIDATTPTAASMTQFPSWLFTNEKLLQEHDNER
jgi:hypothetical protein